MLDASNYTKGLGNFIKRKIGKDLFISEVNEPLILFGIESAIKGSNLEFYAGFSSEIINIRLMFYFQLKAPEESLARNSQIVSKSFEEPRIRYVKEDEILSVYCRVNDPNHIKPNDLYQDIWTYFMGEPLKKAFERKDFKP